MSSRYVRLMAEEWIEALVTPYYRTVNEEQDPQDPMWLTLEWDALGYDKTTYCDTWAETGNITLVWLGPAGVGFDALMERAESDAAIFWQQADPTRKLVLTGRSAPDVLAGSLVPTWEVAITFSYEYRP